MMMEGKPDKEAFCLGSAVDDEDAAELLSQLEKALWSRNVFRFVIHSCALRGCLLCCSLCSPVRAARGESSFRLHSCACTFQFIPM